MNQLEWDTLIRTREALLQARHGEKGAIIARACATLQCDEKTVYRKLAEAGLDTKRKARSDKGQTLYTREQLMLISGLLVESTRRNDKRLLTIEDAVEILVANGNLPSAMSASRVGQLLREHTLHPEQLSHLAPATTMRSLHPNHVWQIDASVCVLFYMRGKQHLQSMPADEFYKNKPQNVARVINELCIRYVCTDHFSGTIWTRYYVGGETSENLIEFFFWCVSQHDSRPAHGVPFMVMLDPGAANTSHLFKNVCSRLQVKLQVNKPGNPRAKGQVENAQNIVERHFEGRLPFLADLSLDSLNAYCERWQAAHNSTKKHSRHGQPRYSMWMRISAEQLRIAPAIELLRELVTTVEETRRVSNTMTVSYSVKGYGRKDYDVRYVPGALVGQTITLVVNPYRAPAIDVRYVEQDTGEIRWMCIEPVNVDAGGFPVSAPVFGEEYQALPHTAADQARGDMKKAAFGVDTLEAADQARKVRQQAYAGVVDVMADVNATEVPTYLPRRGTALDAEKRAIAAAPLTLVEAAKRLKALLGDAYQASTYTWLAERFSDGGVPEDQLQAIAEQLGAGPLRAADADLREEGAEGTPRLRVVGGAR